MSNTSAIAELEGATCVMLFLGLRHFKSPGLVSASNCEQ